MQFGLLIKAHMLLPNCILSYEQNLSMLLLWSCILDVLEDITAKSFTYAIEMIVVFEV